MNRFLLPLTPLYAAAVAAKNRAYQQDWGRIERLRGRVVSVGNLSVGGAGKTPMTIRLAELLRGHGLAVDVLSRGYGRRSDTTAKVDPNGSAEIFGDEPLLIARAGIPVYVGEIRYEAGLLAERESLRVHLLDDGFQHVQLARDVDIVVLHRSDFADHLLPAGRLREGFRALRRAHFVVLREEVRDLEGELRRRGCELPIWWMRRSVELPEARRVVAFCAIARPDDFFDELRRQGCNLVEARTWRDHHAWTAGDLAELAALARRHDAEALLTTEKDWLRLRPEQREALGAVAPLRTAKLTVRFADEPGAVAALLARLSAASPMRK
ncbi:MAG TPA: tetraacyldisaccharide 4'-kinase [Acidobacteriaceae bacterium]|jgi:tetraacyldisaccharide 4'-kinase|nr:tetraacyldisaccharide 4'-kinase [Acidobacteriaceae bacterium]